MLSLPLFKILVDGKSCHGGEYKYPEPEVYTEEIKDVEICYQGYHLTSDPLLWWKPKATLWLAEGQGKSEVSYSKTVFSRVRLLEQVTKDTPGVKSYQRIMMFLVASARSFDPSCDISWANLANANFTNADLRCANLNGANLSNSTFRGANLNSANLSNSTFRGANLTKANLINANLARADLAWANFTDAFLGNADLRDSRLQFANFAYANLLNANVSRTNITADQLGDYVPNQDGILGKKEPKCYSNTSPTASIL